MCRREHIFSFIIRMKKNGISWIKFELRLSEKISKNVSKIKKSQALSNLFICAQNLTVFNQNRSIHFVHRVLLPLLFLLLLFLELLLRLFFCFLCVYFYFFFIGTSQFLQLQRSFSSPLMRVPPVTSKISSMTLFVSMTASH